MLNLTRTARPARALRRLGQDERGVSAIEFALLAPVMLTMFFGMVELSTALMVQRRASHASAAIGDLVSQYGNPAYVSGLPQSQPAAMTPTTMSDIFTGAGLIIYPYPIPPFQGRVSSILVDPKGIARVSWTCVNTNTTTTTMSSSQLQGAMALSASTSPTLASLNGLLTATPGDSLIVVETKYPYQSTLSYFLKNLLNFNSMYYYKPRASSTGVGFYPGATATAWTATWDANSINKTISPSGTNVTCSYQIN